MLLFTSVNCLGAPNNGTKFKFDQPDGSKVIVKLYGDEFHARAESEAGYTVVRDETTGWLSYAMRSYDGSTFVSTKVAYAGQEPDTLLHSG